MQTAIYYPHKRIRSESTFKSALLTYEKVRIVIPRDGFKPEYLDDFRPEYEGQQTQQEKAFDLFGDLHVPSDVEKQEAHRRILEYTSNVPDNLRFDFQTGKVGHLDSEVLLDDTWKCLEDAGLIGGEIPDKNPRFGPDYPAAPTVCRDVMAVLCDCCAKIDGFAEPSTRLAATPEAQSDMIAALGGLRPGASDEQALELVNIAIKTLNPDGIPLETLVKHREKDSKTAAAERNRFRMNMVEQAGIILNAEPKEIARQLADFEARLLKEYSEFLERIDIKAAAWNLFQLSVFPILPALVEAIVHRKEQGLLTQDLLNALARLPPAIMSGTKILKSRADAFKSPLTYLYRPTIKNTKARW